MLKRYSKNVCTLAVVALMPCAAVAQTTGQQPVKNVTLASPAPVKPPNAYSGPLVPAGKGLKNLGVTVNLFYTNYFAANLNQGANYGTTANLGQFGVGANFDLGRILGLEGGSIHMLETIFMFRHHSSDFSKYVIDNPGDTAFTQTKTANDLTQLYYEQILDDKHLDFQIGINNPDNWFDEGTCGPTLTCANPIMKYTAGFLSLMFGQMGAALDYNVNEKNFVRGGVFESFSTPAKDGINLSLSEATGAVMLIQLGHVTNFQNSYYPGQYYLTGFQATSKFQNKETKVYHYGAAGVELKMEQTVWRTASLPTKHIDVFGDVAGTPDVTQPYSFAIDAGVNLYGLVPVPALDHVSLKMGYYLITPSWLEAEKAARVAAKGPDVETSPDEFRFELLNVFKYHNILIIPDVIYIHNPDTYFTMKTAKLPTDGFEFDTKLVIPIGALFGLSPAPTN